MIIWHYLDQLVGSIGLVDQRGERHPSKIDKDGKRHYLIPPSHTEIPSRKTERLKAVREARVKILQSLSQRHAAGIFSSDK